MLIKTLIIALVLLALAFIGLGIRLLLLKGGRFPETHVGHNPAMRKKGITCATNEKMGCQDSDQGNGCSACSHLTGNS